MGMYGTLHLVQRLTPDHSSLFVAMGKKISEDEKNKKAWDTNAITPGTPFMTLLAISLRYWVAKKMNSDAGWKTVSDLTI